VQTIAGDTSLQIRLNHSPICFATSFDGMPMIIVSFWRHSNQRGHRRKRIWPHQRHAPFDLHTGQKTLGHGSMKISISGSPAGLNPSINYAWLGCWIYI